MISRILLRLRSGAALGLLLALSPWSVAEGAAGLAFPIVESGRPVVTVVVQGEDEVVASAVKDFRHYVQQISGAELRIATEEKDLPGPTLHIGETDLFDKVQEARDPINLDGFVAARVGEDLVVTGNIPQGTSNGIMTILQDQFGVRWYYEGDLWEIVPRKADLAVSFVPNRGGAAYVENPSYIARTLWGKKEADEFSTRMRMTLPGVRIPYVGTSHSLGASVPEKKHFENHPEYYALVDGKRNTDNICCTHPDIPEIIMKYIRSGKRGLGVNDNTTVCRCERCLEVDGRSKPYNGMPNISESYFQLIKQLSDRTAQEFPGERLGVFAYQITNAPPKTVKHIGENVDVVLCQDTAQNFDPRYREIDQKMSAEWVRMCGSVRMYDYIGINYWTPRYFPHIMADQLRHMARIGVKGYGTHSSAMIDSSMPMYYLYYQMLWNAEADPDQILSEMLSDLYGAASEPMTKFYQHWENCWERQKKGRWFWGMDNFMGEMQIYRPEDFAKGSRLLGEAASLADDEKVRKRIDFIEERYAYTLAAANAYYKALEAMEGPPPAKAEDATALSDGATEAWKQFAAELERARKLSGTVPSGWLDKTFRVRAWGLKQQMRDAALAPLVKWMRANEGRLDPVTRREIEADFAKRAVANREAIENLVTEEIGASTRLARADGLLVPDIPALDEPLTLNAGTADWSGVPAVESAKWVYRARPEDFKPGRYDEPITQHVINNPDAKDHSVVWQAAWDRRNLYLRIVVTDDVHEQGNAAEGMWKQDSVQIGLTPSRDNFRYPKNSWTYIWGGYRPEDAEFGISLNGGLTDTHVWQAPKSLAATDARALIQTKAARHGDKTIYEAAVSWKLIPGFRASDRRSFGICVTVNDSDNGNRISGEYGSGIAQCKRPTEFAALRLGR